MKKSIVMFFGLLVLSVMTYGQAQVAIGLKGGINLSKLDISQGVSNYNNRTGFNGGAFVLFKLTKIGIQPELLFSKQGASYKVNTTNYEANYDYINVPILLKLYLAGGLNLELGPQFGFLNAADLKNTVTGVTDPQSAKKLFSQNKDMAAVFGLAWDLPFGVVLDARYNLGLSDIKVTPSTNPADAVNFKSKVIQITVGYKLFKLGK